MSGNKEVKELVFSGDLKKMNWLRGDFPYASVRCPENFTWTAMHERKGNELITTIAIQNNGRHAYFTNEGTIGISFPMVDMYDSSAICVDYRCHTHIFCGENTTYVMALRMGGEAPHLGMVVTQGSFVSYSVERDLDKMSNDRGCFWLHPAPKEFAPGEIMTVSWTIFPHQGKEDFYEKLKSFASVIQVRAEHYVIYPGEKIPVEIIPPVGSRKVEVNGSRIEPKEDGSYSYVFQQEKTGEYLLHIQADQVHTRCRLLVQERPEVLMKKRCQFISEHQQYQGAVKELQGAYLIYDNEEKHLVYREENDFNAARERIGMGVLMARMLQRQGCSGCEKEEKSLQVYYDYMLREIVDRETGLVCDDTGRDTRHFRLYNYPWAATFFVECWKLWKHPEDLQIAGKVIGKYYQEGGYRFYPIEMPITSICEELKKAGKTEMLDELCKMFRKHGDNLLINGKLYPASEVNFEQSIVAPAADVLLQVYEITGEQKYLDGAKEQIAMLDLFNGQQPDYHLYEVAIRHWDGYWFGKTRLYGDTFPHYCSAETGRAFRRYARLTGDQKFAKKAEDSLRGVLSMFFADGTATCAYLFPYSVNGQRGEFADAYANDQDWGLCSNLEE